MNSNTRGLTSGGETPSNSDVIDYITFSTTGDATDFGNLTVARNWVGGASSSTRGLTAGGRTQNQDVIDYVTINTTGNATDFGDLTSARYSVNGASNTLRAVFRAVVLVTIQWIM